MFIYTDRCYNLFMKKNIPDIIPVFFPKYIYYLALTVFIFYMALHNYRWLSLDRSSLEWDAARHAYNCQKTYNIFFKSDAGLIKKYYELFIRTVEYTYGPVFYFTASFFRNLTHNPADGFAFSNIIYLALLAFFSFRSVFFLTGSAFTSLVCAVMIFYLPQITGYSRLIMLDFALTGIIAAAFYFYLKSDHLRRRRYTFIFFSVCAIGLMTKITFYIYFLIPAVYTSFIILRRILRIYKMPCSNRRLRLLKAYRIILLPALVPVIFFFLPWLIYHYDELVKYREHWQRGAVSLPVFLNLLKTFNPLVWMHKSLLENLGKLYFFFPAAIILFFIKPVISRKKQFLLLGIILAFFYWAYSDTYHEPRTLQPIYPFAVIFTLLPLAFLEKIRQKAIRTPVKIILIVLSFFMVVNNDKTVNPPATDKTDMYGIYSRISEIYRSDKNIYSCFFSADENDYCIENGVMNWAWTAYPAFFDLPISRKGELLVVINRKNTEETIADVKKKYGPAELIDVLRWDNNIPFKIFRIYTWGDAEFNRPRGYTAAGSVIMNKSKKNTPNHLSVFFSRTENRINTDAGYIAYSSRDDNVREIIQVHSSFFSADHTFKYLIEPFSKNRTVTAELYTRPGFFAEIHSDLEKPPEVYFCGFDFFDCLPLYESAQGFTSAVFRKTAGRIDITDDHSVKIINSANGMECKPDSNGIIPEGLYFLATGKKPARSIPLKIQGFSRPYILKRIPNTEIGTRQQRTADNKIIAGKFTGQLSWGPHSIIEKGRYEAACMLSGPGKGSIRGKVAITAMSRLGKKTRLAEEPFAFKGSGEAVIPAVRFIVPKTLVALNIRVYLDENTFDPENLLLTEYYLKKIIDKP
ncbi:MAG TPA: hypothetical protein DC049_05300 [Spirochaetia bacterium]|nr:hypothetical protein [Spirochaetia bacterium]